MKVETLLDIIGSDFYTGVPDSQLKPLCDYLVKTYGSDPQHHIIGANEGNCAAIAAGYHLATGKIPVVYLQNSGEGNLINPVASLLSDRVYAIPAVFIIGWRGEPSVPDEPQHLFQGEVTLKLLEDMEIAFFVIGKDTDECEVRSVMEEYRNLLRSGKNVAFVVRKGALTTDICVKYKNGNCLNREEVIRHIVQMSGADPIISTTGKISRELFEVREKNGQSHNRDFLTVGSMGHSSSIALGVALRIPQTKVWCVDGDGAALMHMGAMAIIGTIAPMNLIHIIINNGAHESVGGMPTAASQICLSEVAVACGYPYAACVERYEDLDAELAAARERGTLSLIEVRCSIGSRSDLGRPTGAALDNKNGFMEFLRTINSAPNSL